MDKIDKKIKNKLYQIIKYFLILKKSLRYNSKLSTKSQKTMRPDKSGGEIKLFFIQ
jgi:hypothetical protein